MSEIILSSGAYHKFVSGSSSAKTVIRNGGYSLTTAVLDILSANTCCTKNIVADSLTVEGPVTFSSGSSTLYSAFYPSGAIQSIAAGAGGAINVTSYFTNISTDAGGDAFTLANGAVIGQLKEIYLLVDGGGNATITPANLASGTTITMNDAGDSVILLWNGTDWVVIKNIGSTIA
jgi:hypothetical protein